MATVINNYGCHALLLNSVEDHIHILFALGRTVAVSKAVEEIKTTSSKWIKTQGTAVGGFAWQVGYGAFAVDMSSIARERDYIAGQAKHHRVETFQDEYRRFLTEHGVSFDERYVWD
ncbi:MAG TPA: transposase [Chthonomonadaceae bacterium]|nr:transposase [Chthonomonadaceae bacterium]